MEKDEVLRLLEIKGNEVCADCCAPAAEWASWSLGVVLCLGCSGIHRNLGVHISRVKSVRLDKWTKEQYDAMLEIGNVAARRTWEARLPPGFPRPSAEDPVELMEQFIRAKYERKEFVEQGGGAGLASVLQESVPTFSGTVVKQGGRIKSWRKRHMVLCGSMVTYCKRVGDLKVAGYFSLTAVTKVSSRASVPGHPHVFALEVGTREYLISASSAIEFYMFVSLCRYLIVRLVKCEHLQETTDSASDIDCVVRRMKDEIKLTRRQFGKAIADCFLGSSLIDWLIYSGFSSSRAGAMTTAQALLDQGHVKAMYGDGKVYEDGFVGYSF